MNKEKDKNDLNICFLDILESIEEEDERKQMKQSNIMDNYKDITTSVLISLKHGAIDYCYSYIETINIIKEIEKSHISCFYYKRNDETGDFDYSMFVPATFYDAKGNIINKCYDIFEIPKDIKCVITKGKVLYRTHKVIYKDCGEDAKRAFYCNHMDEIE